MRVEAVLYLMGTQLVPDEVTSVLGLPPSQSERKGEERVYSLNRLAIAQTGLWVFSTARSVEGNSVADHLRFLTDLIGDKVADLKAQRMIDSARIGVKIQNTVLAPWSEEFEPGLLTRLANLAIPLTITVES